MRPNSFADNGFGFGEPELDANSALTELDKGLRSAKIGEQCEAIVRFPALFERYPFPILINSAFLKLADVFRTGSNFLRLWVLRVCQESERHLDKILNTDDFIRRIFSVIHSNDPIARALTLRTLGSLSGLIPERKPVHHSIRVALDSHDGVEVSAAIYAASCFAKRSKTFGTTMCTKISTMVQRLSTPIDLKLRLIPIFQHMHHDIATAAMVRKLCQELLLNYPSEEFVITTLNTLTQLSASTISDLTEQVSFLLTNLDDSRPQVKLSVLRDLKFLGQKGGHLWEPIHISTLINCALSHNTDRMDTDESYNNHTLDVNIVYTTLDVINSVTSSSAILTFIYAADSKLWKLLETSIQSKDITISLRAIQIATYIAVNWKNERLSMSGMNLVDMAASGVESLVKTICFHIKEDDNDYCDGELKKNLEKCLSYGILLCKAKPAKCEWFCSALMTLFKLDLLTAATMNVICQSIGAIGSFNQDAVQKLLNEMLTVLEKVTETDSSSSTVAVIIAIILQVHQGFTLADRPHNVVTNTIKSSNLWLAYRSVRNALRFGQPGIAASALKGMSAKVSSENFHFWLSSLDFVARAENILTESEKTPVLITRLNEAITLYTQSVASLRAASNPITSLQFQIEYVRIRSEMLVAFSNFFVSCDASHFSPAPAIAPSMALTNRDELLKSGRVVTQLRKSIREFQGVSEMYGRLYQTAFDADGDTLLNIQILQQVCLLVARAIEKQVVSKDHPSFSDSDQAYNFCSGIAYSEASNSWATVQSCKQALVELQEMKSLPTQVLNYQHMDCLRETFRILIETPISYPRYFFQTLQMTRVKIAVSPQPRIPGESVTVLMGNNFALKVEGVIQQTGIQGGSKNSESLNLFRKPKAIRITVVSSPAVNTRPHPMDLNKTNQEPVTLVKDVVPHRDFFTAQFLLGVCSGGLTSVTVDTSLVDYEGRLWMTGPRATLSVRAFEETGPSGSKGNVSTPTQAPRQLAPGMIPGVNLGGNVQMSNRF